MSSGFVTLVGAGPSRAEYLTLAGFKAIKAADIIFYDALLAPDIRSIFPPSSKLVFVGKRCGKHSFTQTQINELLIRYAQKGKKIVRLKGGDPFIFGRGYEEIAALKSAKIPYRVIPGVSALNGVAAELNFPLTHRLTGNEFRVIQGHNLPKDFGWWQDLARYQGTTAIFMGFEKLSETVASLLHAGASQDLPVAVVESGLSPKLTVTTLSAYAQSATTRAGEGPIIVYLGWNVSFLDQSKDTYFFKPHTNGVFHEYAVANFP